MYDWCFSYKTLFSSFDFVEYISYIFCHLQTYIFHKIHSYVSGAGLISVSAILIFSAVIWDTISSSSYILLSIVSLKVFEFIHWCYYCFSILSIMLLFCRSMYVLFQYSSFSSLTLSFNNSLKRTILPFFVDFSSRSISYMRFPDIQFSKYSENVSVYLFLQWLRLLILWYLFIPSVLPSWSILFSQFCFYNGFWYLNVWEYGFYMWFLRLQGILKL